MKLISRILNLAALAAAVSFTACTDDNGDPGQDGNVTFPEKQVFGSEDDPVEPGESFDLTFNAEADWTLTAKTPWLNFEDEVLGAVSSVSGQSGDQTVKVLVLDNGQGFSGETGSIEMTMAGETQVVAEVVRSGREREIRMVTYNDEGGVQGIESLDFAYGDRNLFLGFEANYGWKIASWPEWLICDTDALSNLHGEADAVYEDYTGMVMVAVDETVLYTDQNGVISISDIDGNNVKEFPVTAAGIAAGELSWITPENNLRGGLQWNSAGQQVISSTGGTAIKDEPFELSFITRDNDYEVKYVVYDPDTDIASELAGDVESCGFTVSDNGAGMLTIEAEKGYDGEEQRALYLFILPSGVTGSEEFYSSYFVDDEFQFTDYSSDTDNRRKSLGIELRQTGKPGGFIVMTGSLQELKDFATPVEDSGEMVAKLGLTVADNIYCHTFTAEEWASSSEGGLHNRISIVPKGNNVEQSDRNWKFYNSDYEEVPLIAGDGIQSVSANWFGDFNPNCYGPDYQPIFGLNFGDRKSFATIPGDLIVVFYDGDSSLPESKDIGTFVFKFDK